jgi:hypothetical protein
MSDNLGRAIAAIRAGDTKTGQRLLAEVILSDPRNETAWLWMSSVVDSEEHRRMCLERALAINPNNKTARRALEVLRQKQAPLQADKQPMPPPAAAQPVQPIPATEIKQELLGRMTVEKKSYPSPLTGKIRGLIILGIILIVLFVLWIAYILASASLLRNNSSQ